MKKLWHRFQQIQRMGIRHSAQKIVNILRSEGMYGIQKRLWQRGSVNPHFRSDLRLVDNIQVVPSVRPFDDDDYSLAVPFHCEITHSITQVAVIMHIFYPEYAEEILAYLNHIPVTADLFISTNTIEKQQTLMQAFSTYTNGKVDIRIFPNRGRDIAPKLIGFREVYDHYEYFLHLHSKKSPHGGGPLKSWRQYLFSHLLGSREIVTSIFHLLSKPEVGIIFPQHLFQLRGILNWGYDFDLAKNLLRKVGIKLNKNLLLEFPSGSMFWGKSAAFRELLNLPLTFADFPEEQGQIDGTLAHAIERSYLFFVEQARYRWLKIGIKDLYPKKKTVLNIHQLEDIDRYFNQVYTPLLIQPHTRLSACEREFPETMCLLPSPSTIQKPRLNLIIPTINPNQIFGGIATAIHIFKQLQSELGERFDYRILTTEYPPVPTALSAFPNYTICPLQALDQIDTCLIVDAHQRLTQKMPLRASDIFIVSAWWNAAQAQTLMQQQQILFGKTSPLIYLIQDFEPNFHGWSSQWMLAEGTYRIAADKTIAIINSIELYHYIQARYHFAAQYLLPYQINQTIKTAIKPAIRKKQLLFYGRPTILRNCFELIIDGISRWQSRNPVLASEWKIISVGESYTKKLAMPVQNIAIHGKLTLLAYAELLSTAQVGISLMASPHPSYPPLEMAQAGLITITNLFESKNLSRYSDRIISLDQVDADTIADAIEVAIEKSDLSHAPDFESITNEYELDPANIFNPKLFSAELISII